MTEMRSLKINFIWAFLGNAIAGFCSWVLLILLAKFATVEVVGVYGVSKAVCLPIITFLGLQLTIVQTTDAQDKYSFGHYCALRILTSCAAIILSVLVGLVFYTGEVLHIIFLLSISLSVFYVRDIFLGQLRKSERMDRVAVSRAIQGVLSVILFSIMFFLSKSLALSILGLICAGVIVLWIHDIPVTRMLLSSSAIESRVLPTRQLWSKKVLWDLTKTSLPLGLVGLFQALYVSIPRLVLDKHFGREQVGYFSALASLLTMATMVITALGHSVTPRLAKYYFENIKAYKRLLGKLIAISIVIGVSGITISSLFGKLLLTLMFQADYAEYNDVFVWITISGAVLYIFSFMNAGLCAARKFKVQIPIYGSVTATCFVFSVWLIPYYGMKGAVWAIIASYSVGMLSSAVFVVKAIKERAMKDSNESNPD